MLNKKITTAAFLAAVLLTGCSSPNESPESMVQSEESSVSEGETPTEAKSENEETKSSESSLPIISIQTENQSSDALKFVTDPVTRHVAEAKASWTPGYKIPIEPYYEKCRISVTNTDSEFVLDNVEADVKVRGNWTTVYDKKPLRLNFTEKQNLLGLNNGKHMKNWLLLAEYKDASLLRDKTAFEVARDILGEDGLYASDAALVEVQINGEYWGVYLLAEMQQVNKDRVSITDPEKDYQGTDIGYFLEYDGYFTNEDALHCFEFECNDNAPLVPYDGNENTKKKIEPRKPENDIGISIKSNIFCKEQHDFIASFVNNAYNIMYEAAYNDKAYVFSDNYSSISPSSDITPQEAVEMAVDVDSLADMYIISELTCDADIYWSSFFMDADFGENGSKKLRFEAPWDFDSSMGNKDRCMYGDGFYAANIVPDVNGYGEYINPWLAVLMHEEWFEDIIKEKWTKAYDNGVFEKASAMIAEDTTEYGAEFDKNYEKWENICHESFIDELSMKSAKCKTQKEAADFLKEWFDSRVEFMNSNWHK